MPVARLSTPSYRSIIFDRLGSTNQEGIERARQGDRGRLWIRALVQTAGRGRIGRPWSSPPGNLYTSLLLVDPAPPRLAPQLGFVAGVALARAVRRLPDVLHEVRLKWPNDLVCRGAKLAGILIEGCRRPDGAAATVIGFGVNCGSHPETLDYPATDLEALSGSSQSVDDLARYLATEMAEALDLWDRGLNFAPLRQRWLELAHARGAPLTVKTSASRIEGFFDTIDENGRLVLTAPGGSVTIEAADVFAPTSRDAAVAPS